MKAGDLTIALSVFAIACSDYEVKSTNGANADLSGDGTPEISVSPVSISFPSLDASSGLNATEVVIVTNVGDADLHISDIYLEDDTGPFSLNAISSPLLPPAGTAQFAVTFAPTTAASNIGIAHIESDDPVRPVVDISLNGIGVAPIIDITPNAYDFGTLYIGCNSEQYLTISNVGTAELIISNFGFSTASPDIAFDSLESSNGPLPWSLQPNQTLDVSVAYNPYDEVSDQAFLTVTSNDPYTPDVLVTQEGTGEIFNENQDQFEQPIKGSTDIIFAVDRSCSMDEDINNVQNNFGTFVNTLADMDADYHVAATVEDDGCINGPDLFIDNSFSASDATGTITTMINLSGSYGMNTEAAFALLEECLAESVSSNGCNAGLIRDDAKLALVGISDEQEQSPGYSSNSNYWQTYVSLFQSLKSNPDDLVIHAIGGDAGTGCGNNDPYTGMIEAANATGGLFLSLCATDWGAHLEALAEGSAADLSSFPLTDYPVPETIVVKINGITTTVGWEYNSSINSVDFDTDYIPEGGSTIDVDYAVYGNCSQ
ncbi:MAG: choice-of-anchor D domain-containing protein [Myxococcota bacterium]|nr:choice-of-anchor D domain-containing protein [Myxococcota bacterium]